MDPERSNYDKLLKNILMSVFDAYADGWQDAEDAEDMLANICDNVNVLVQVSDFDVNDLHEYLKGTHTF